MLQTKSGYDKVGFMEKQLTNKAQVTTDDNVVVYEVSYLLLPSLATEQVSLKAESLKEQLSSLGGRVVSLENPVLIDLAYSMTKVVQTVRHKVSRGYFGWIKFEISRQGIEKVKKVLDADIDIVRYLIIKTVHENTLLNGKMKLGREDVKEALPEIPKEPLVEEDIDKSIDDLVIA